MKIIFVGFSVKQDKSVFDENHWKKYYSTLGRIFDQAILKDCDFVSVRFIKEELKK